MDRQGPHGWVKFQSALTLRLFKSRPRCIAVGLKGAKTVGIYGVMGTALGFVEQKRGFLVWIVLRHPRLEISVPDCTAMPCNMVASGYRPTIAAYRQLSAFHCLKNFFCIRPQARPSGKCTNRWKYAVPRRLQNCRFMRGKAAPSQRRLDWLVVRFFKRIAAFRIVGVHAFPVAHPRKEASAAGSGCPGCPPSGKAWRQTVVYARLSCTTSAPAASLSR